MSINSEELLKYAYFTCIPEIYREEDSKLGLPMYRYLQAITKGGYELEARDIDNLLNIIDPEKCPDRIFPTLYESFGFEYFPDVDIKYHRKFLMNFGELRKRRGTYSSIRFLVRVLTSMDVKQSYLRGEYEGKMGRHLILDLQANSVSDIVNMGLSKSVIEQFLVLFLPYYITTYVTNSVVPVSVGTTRYRGGAIVQRTKYVIGGE